MARLLLLLASAAVLGLVASAEARRDPKHFVDKKLQAMASDQASKERQGKVMSLFNVVTFDNGPCESTSSITSGSGASNRNGTCFTSSECRDKGGEANGNCAAGFGVCCVFTYKESGDTINYNCSYIQNPNFPSALPNAEAVRYTIEKCDDSVCSFRLDFEQFTIGNTGNTEERMPVNAALNVAANSPHACLDTFQASTSSTNQVIPVICGQNTGQHIYLDVGQDRSASATLDFAFNSLLTGQNRQWEIKVTQVKCGFENAPSGCLQYFTGLTGRFETFNFQDTVANHLPNQDYQACVRQEEGFCCVQYTPCADETNPFSIWNTEDKGQQGSECPEDYITLPASSPVCVRNSNVNLETRYCGKFLSNVPDADLVQDVACDCTAPFTIGVHTDALPDGGAVGTANLKENRGVCLTWQQIPCDV